MCLGELIYKAYLNLSFHISIYDKNCRCLEELIKLAYDLLISHFQVISINFMEKLIKKRTQNSLYERQKLVILMIKMSF